MSDLVNSPDIIESAQRLLDGATPAPWEVRTYDIGGAVYGIGEIEPGYGGGDPLDCLDKDAYLAAAAPELAQALAEESYEYSFQVQNTIDMWEHPSCAGEPDGWWDTESEAEEYALAAHEYGYPIRIVRRRVSPVEVIND